MSVLALSALLDLGIGVVLIVSPELEGRQLGLTATPELVFVGHVLSCFMFMLAAVLLVTVRELQREAPLGLALAGLMGLFWLATGAVLFAHTGRLGLLALDSVRGLVILALVGALAAARRPEPATPPARA
jgi:hypothetical protein